MKRLLLLVVLMFSFAVCSAEPSKNEITNAVNSGNYVLAESLIDQVITNHPNSAKAHYLKSQILAKESKIDSAKQELQTATTIDPAGTFTTPEKLNTFKNVLASSVVTKTVVTSNTVSTKDVVSPRPVYVHTRADFTVFYTVILIALLIILCWYIIDLFFWRPTRQAVYNQSFIGNSGVNYSEPYFSNTYHTTRGNNVGGGGAGGTTIINGGGYGNNGLVEGMVIGSMLSNHHNGGYYDDGGGYRHGHSAAYDDTYERDTTTTTTTTETTSTPSFSYDSGSSSSSDWSSSSSSSSSSDWSSSSYDSGSSSSDW